MFATRESCVKGGNQNGDGGRGQGGGKILERTGKSFLKYGQGSPRQA